MALGYLLNPALQVEDADGKPLVSGFIRVYRHGTTEPIATYKDFTGDLNPVDIVLNNKGMCIILVDPNYLYDAYCYDSHGVEQWSRLNVGCYGGSGDGRYYVVESTDNSVDVTSSTDPVTSETTIDLSVQHSLDNYKQLQTPVDQSYADYGFVKSLKQTANGEVTLECSYVSEATPSTTGLMSSTDKSKLDNIQSGAEVNQNAFSNLKVGNTTIAADSKTDTLELVAGGNITLTPNANDDSLTISATDTTYTAGSGLALNGTEFSNTAPNVKSDWNAAAGSAAEILNKPTIPDNVFHAEYGVATVAEISAAKNAGKEVFTLIPGTYYSTVAYLREVTRNGAHANFASVTSDGASVKTATVDSSGNWSNATVNLATTTDSSLVQKKNYGDTEPSRVATLLIDSDDPEAYAQVKADNATKGYLVQGPYKVLLDSGINNGSGVGDGNTPVYIDSDGTFQSCNALTAGSNVQINGTTISATDTTYTAGSYIDITNNVITNTMHQDTYGLMISYNTLGNSGTTTHSIGPWRIQVTKAAMAAWDSVTGATSLHIAFAHESYLDGSITHGRILVDTLTPWADGAFSTVYTVHNQWAFDGTYAQGGSNEGFGLQLISPGADPDGNARACPKTMRGYHFTVNCGINGPDWLECDASLLYINNNTSLTSNAARLLLRFKYFYI